MHLASACKTACKTRGDVQTIIRKGWMPADDMNAAPEINKDFGTSRRQLWRKATSIWQSPGRGHRLPLALPLDCLLNEAVLVRPRLTADMRARFTLFLKR